MLITAAAVSRLYSMKYMLVKLIRPIVTTFICGLLITTIGQKNSFQLHMNLMISSVAMAGFTDGRITEEEDPELAGAVDAGRVDVVVGNHLDGLPHQEDAEDADQVRRHDARVGIEQPELVHPDVERHHDRLERDHQDADDGEEEDVPSGEAILRESEPRQRRDHHAADGGDRRDDARCSAGSAGRARA